METPKASSASDQYDSAINPGNHGINFEKDLALLTFVAASLAECRFKLAVEMKAAEKFDDVVLYNEESKDVWLLQAKHSKDGGRISYDDLFSTDPKKSNFAFCKYLQSHLKIRENAVFKDYKPTVFIYTNKSLDKTDKLTKWLNIRTQNVNSIIRWCDPEKYVCFEPLNDEAVSNITRIMNSELLVMKEDIEKLSKTGKASDLLVQYKAPLQNILQISNGIISFKEPKENSIDFVTHQWLLSEFKVKPNEDFCVEKLDDRTIRNLNSFFTGSSRNKQFSVPKFVTEDDTREFFKSLIFCVEQPTDLRSVAEELISAWMQQWVGSDDLGQFGKDQTKVFQSYFDQVFDKWHSITNTPKNYLKFEIEGSTCIQRMKTDMKKKLLRKNTLISYNASMYVRRTIIITEIKDEDNEKDSQNITSDGRDKISIRHKRSKVHYNARLGRSNLQTKHVRDKEFMEHLNKITDETKCQVLVGEPGMGKTTLMSHLYAQLEQLQNVDVYLIRLKHLKVCLGKNSGLLHIFQHELSQESRNILLRDLQNKESRILFLLDGFDEMNPSYFGLVVEAIENLLRIKNTQFIITGRNNVRPLLEDKFEAIALNLKPFDHNEQVKFLELFWQVNEHDVPLFKTFSKRLLEKFHSEIKANDYDFTGLPLMIRMLAEVYTDDFRTFLRAEGNTPHIELSGNLNVLSLFEKFVNFSFNMEIKKMMTGFHDAYNDTEEEINKRMKPSFDVLNKQFQLLAIQYLEIAELKNVTKAPQYVELLNQILESVEHGTEKFTLISVSSKTEFDFIHLSYAEYFVAKFIFDHMKKCKFYIKNIIKKRDVVRKFLFLMVENSENAKPLKIVHSLYSRDSLVIALACVGGHEKIATKLLKTYSSVSSKSLRKMSINSPHSHHRILLHAAASGGSTVLVLILLDKLKMDLNYSCSQSFYGTVFDFIEPGDFAIHVAIRKNHLDIVQLLVDRNAELNEGNRARSTPLHIAAEKGYLDLVKLLIACNANVNTTIKDDWTPLRVAVSEGHSEVVKTLIASNANVNITSSRGWTLLNEAASKEHIEIMKILIDSKANVNTANSSDWTLLHEAASKGHLEMVQVLINCKANVNAANSNGVTPLHQAAKMGHIEVMKMLIDSKANVNTANSNGWTLLHDAASRGNLEVVKMLIYGKANVNALSNDGRTPLHEAASKGHIEVTKMLIESKANVNTANSSGWTLLHEAASKGHLEMVKVLINGKANVNTPNSSGMTPLHEAASMGHVEVVKMLIASNAHVDTRDKTGWTPLHSACYMLIPEVGMFQMDHEESEVNCLDINGTSSLSADDDHMAVTASLLRHNKTDMNISTYDDSTELHNAAKRGHVEMAKLLIRHGADINAQNEEGKTPLQISHGNHEMEYLLLSYSENNNIGK